MSRNGKGVRMDLRVSVPARRERTPSPSPSSSSESEMSSPASSCVSSEGTDDGTSPGTEAAMMLAGCPRCLMYVMLSESDPRCPKCHSSVLLDFLSDPRPSAAAAARHPRNT